MSNPLLQLPESSGVQFVIKLRLPDQQNLQQFFLRGFQVRQKTNFFKDVGRKMVCLVYDQYGGELFRTSADHKVAEIEKNFALVPARGRKTKVARDVLQELNGRQAIVKNVRVSDVIVLPQQLKQAA